MEINAANLQGLFRGYRVAFMEQLQGAPPVSEAFMMRVPSTAMIEEYDWLGAVPGMQELVTEIQIANLSAAGWTIRNKEWYSTVGVKQFRIETDTYGIYTPTFASMGLAARQHPDQLNAALLAGGFTNKCYTGSYFFGANQVSVPGSLYPFTNTGTELLTPASYATRRANLAGRLNAQGRAMGLGLDLRLVVPPALESTARAVIIADTVLQSNAQGGAAAVSNIQANTAKIQVFPQLAAYSNTAWFLLEVGYPIKPLVFQTNKDVTLLSLTNPESDHVFKRHEFLYQAYARYNSGYMLPELAEGSTGTGQ